MPPLPSSNSAFVEHVVRDLAPGARPAVCSKAGDPTAGGWAAEAAADVDSQCPGDRNNYLNCSSFVVDDQGGVQARKDGFSAFHLLVLDDVGTKVDRSRLVGFTPTWEIETSPGNSQIGICLTQPERDQDTVKRLQDAVMAAGLCDKGAGGLARWVRLPYAINGKPKYHSQNGQPVSCRLVGWNPEVSYTVDGLAKALGLDLASPSPARQAAVSGEAVQAMVADDDVYTPALTENPVVSALKERRLYKREIALGKHDVTCPWAHEHTDGLDTGAAYFEPDESHPVGGYKCQHSHGDRYRVGELLKFLEVGPDRARGKARIRLVPGEMNGIRRAAEHALALRGGYYQSGGAIVAIRTEPLTGDISTELLGEPALTVALADAVDWQRYDRQSKDWVRCDPPARSVQMLHKAQGYQCLPTLRGLARQPFFRDSDGQLVSTPGYDAASGYYAAFDRDAFPLPEPTEQAARAALAELEELLSEFHFASPVDRSAALCAMLTGAVRPSLPMAPAFNLTASTPGSGKSYLASTITPFAGPGAALKVSYPISAEEASKAMLSVLVQAPAAVVFDDMQTQWVPHGVINRMLTSDTITDRVLGVSRTVTVGTRTLFLGTGNNVGPIRDMSRRVVTIRLHPLTATPATLSYKGDPAKLVRERRGQYVAAALTIISAWKLAGSPKSDVCSIASYDGLWNDLCRQPLLWLGLPDPATSLIAQVQHDPDQDDLGQLLRSWHDLIGEKPVMLRQVLDAASDHPDLEEALQDLPVVDREVINRSKLGWYLKRHVNRIVDGLELQAAESSIRNAWRVVAVQVLPNDPG
jgi:hypothetical protein